LDVFPFTMPVKRFAKKIGKSEDEASQILEILFENDCVMRVRSKAKPNQYEYGIHLPFLFFDAPVLNFRNGYSDEKAKRVAELSLKFLEEEAWYKNFEGSPETPLSRILPVQESIPVGSKILPYEDIEKIIDNAEVLSLMECACRARLEMVNRRHCIDKFPLETCIGVNQGGQYVIDRGKGRELSKDEAKELIKKFNKMGLVQTTENFQDGPHMILCSCCPCCCNLLGGITKSGWNNPRAIAATNFIAQIKDRSRCKKCKQCLQKCPFTAISFDDSDEIIINPEKCMGCGICIANCENDVLELVRFERETVFKDQIQLGLKVSTDTNRKIKL